MKEYKYTIDGVEYKVEIGEIVDNVAEVTVNGEAYKVEMEPEKEPERRRLFSAILTSRLQAKSLQQALQT